jgi:hypothetical protein
MATTSKIILCAIALVLGALSFIFSYVGLPGNYDTEPILAIALILIAIAGFSE